MAHLKGDHGDSGGMEVTEKDGEYIVDSPLVSMENYLSTHPSDKERIDNFRANGP